MKYHNFPLLLCSAKLAIGITSEPAATDSPATGSRSSDPVPSVTVPASPLIALNASQSKTSSPHNNESSIIHLGFGLPTCRGEYGSDMSRNSCLNAWRSIPDNLLGRRYGRRFEGEFDVPVPQRYLSGKFPWLGQWDGELQSLI